MTARQIDPPLGCEQVTLDNYLKELTAAGHIITVQVNHLGGKGYRCTSCHEEFRLYDHSGIFTIFSDFEEQQQCGQKQMNVLTLMGRGTSG